MIKTQLTVLMPQKLRKIQLTPSAVAELVLEHGRGGGNWWGGTTFITQINISDPKTSSVRKCSLFKATKAPTVGN